MMSASSDGCMRAPTNHHTGADLDDGVGGSRGVGEGAVGAEAFEIEREDEQTGGGTPLVITAFRRYRLQSGYVAIDFQLISNQLTYW